jgi:hypothetical protein
VSAIKAGGEAAFQQQVLNLAGFFGWDLTYHTHDSRRSHKGWPDLVLCRPPELLVVELKAEKTRVTNDQLAWLAALDACGIETYLWRPADLPAIQARLSRARKPRPGEDLGTCPVCERDDGVHQAPTGALTCTFCRAAWSGIRRRIAA